MERNTTERFFIVKEDTPFFRQFVAYEEFVDKSCKVFSAFAEQTGMDKSTKFYPDLDQLGIIPVGKDAETFGLSFVKAKQEGGLRLFRKKSIINNRWREAAKKAGLQFVRRPSPSWDLGLHFRGSFRMFEHDGKLYLSLETPIDLGEKVHKDLVDIKGCEFWRVIVAIEEERKDAS